MWPLPVFSCTRPNGLGTMSGGYTLIHSGCTLPGDGEPLLRNESVGIMLDHDQYATDSWKITGELRRLQLSVLG